MSCNCPIRSVFRKLSLGKNTSSARLFSSSAGGSSGAKKTDQDAKKPKRQALKKPSTPTGKFDDENVTKTEYLGSNVIEPFPNNINPETGEVGGPRGLEPTRFGDWERKGRVTDF